MKLEENEKKSWNKSLVPDNVLPHSDNLKVNGYQPGMWLCLLMRWWALIWFLCFAGFFWKTERLVSVNSSISHATKLHCSILTVVCCQAKWISSTDQKDRLESEWIVFFSLHFFLDLSAYVTSAVYWIISSRKQCGMATGRLCKLRSSTSLYLVFN